MGADSQSSTMGRSMTMCEPCLFVGLAGFVPSHPSMKHAHSIACSMARFSNCSGGFSMSIYTYVSRNCLRSKCWNYRPFIARTGAALSHCSLKSVPWSMLWNVHASSMGEKVRSQPSLRKGKVRTSSCSCPPSLFMWRMPCDGGDVEGGRFVS